MAEPRPRSMPLLRSWWVIVLPFYKQVAPDGAGILRRGHVAADGAGGVRRGWRTAASLPVSDFGRRRGRCPRACAVCKASVAAGLDTAACNCATTTRRALIPSGVATVANGRL